MTVHAELYPDLAMYIGFLGGCPLGPNHDIQGQPSLLSWDNSQEQEICTTFITQWALAWS